MGGSRLLTALCVRPPHGDPRLEEGSVVDLRPHMPETTAELVSGSQLALALSSVVRYAVVLLVRRV